jgi:hypothetical protein
MLVKTSVPFGSDFYWLAFRAKFKGDVVMVKKIFKLSVNTYDIHDI